MIKEDWLLFCHTSQWRMGLYPDALRLKPEYHPSNVGLKPIIYRTLAFRGKPPKIESFDGKRFVTHNPTKFYHKVWTQNIFTKDFHKYVGEGMIEWRRIEKDLMELSAKTHE